jgi:serine/threonine protein kinase
MKPTEPASEGSNEGSAFPPAGRGLPPGSRLGGFELTGIIAEGEVTIVYAATDAASNAEVAIAEYMPARLAGRDREGHVTPNATADDALFTRGLDAFVDETRTLARCDHPSLVRILGQWESNSTAYRVMPRHRGTLLVHAREAMTEPPDEASVRALLDALLGALGAFHATGHSHGNVTPFNILILDDGRPLLLEPNAAGRAIAADEANPPVASAESGFAPIEQIVEPDVEPPFSADLYALAGVARYWISGELPGPALRGADAARHESVADTVERLAVSWPRLYYSVSLLDTLDSALSIYPAQRPQTVAQWLDRLPPAPPPTAPSVDAPSPVEAVRTDAVAEPPRSEAWSPAPRRRRVAMWIYACLIVLALLGIGVHEYGQDYGLPRVLDMIGLGRLDDAGDRAPRAAPEAPAPAPAPGAGTGETASPPSTTPPSTTPPAPEPAGTPAPATPDAASTDAPKDAAAPAAPPATNRVRHRSPRAREQPAANAPSSRCTAACSGNAASGSGRRTPSASDFAGPTGWIDVEAGRLSHLPQPGILPLLR